MRVCRFRPWVAYVCMIDSTVYQHHAHHHHIIHSLEQRRRHARGGEPPGPGPPALSGGAGHPDGGAPGWTPRHFRGESVHTYAAPAARAPISISIHPRYIKQIQIPSPLDQPPNHTTLKNYHQKNIKALGNVAEVHRRNEDCDRALPLFQGAIAMKKAAMAAAGRDGRVRPMDAMGGWRSGVLLWDGVVVKTCLYVRVGCPVCLSKSTQPKPNPSAGGDAQQLRGAETGHGQAGPGHHARRGGGFVLWMDAW